MGRSSGRYGSLVALALLAVAPYLRALEGPFLWDDNHILARNRATRSILHIPRLFLPNEWERLHRAVPSPYRPCREATFAILIGTRLGTPFAFRTLNLALHAVSALLLYALIRMLVRPPSTAWWGAAIFAVHPAHVESVAWIKNLGELQAFVFAAGSMLCFFIGSREQRRKGWFDRWTVLSTLLFTVALLTKESVAFVPLALLIAAGFGLAGSDKREGALRILPMLIVLGIYAALQARVLLGQRVDYLTPLGPFAGLERVLLVLRTFACYAGIILFPAPLVPWRSFSLTTEGALEGGGAIMISLGMALAVIALYRKERSVAWWLIAGILALGPAANLAVNASRPVAEQRAYAPSMAGAVVVGWVIAKTRNRWRAAAMWLGCLALISLGTLSWQQTGIWRNPYALWKAAVRTSPDRHAAHGSLAMAYYNVLGKDRLAQQSLLMGLALDPTNEDFLKTVAPLIGSQEILFEREKWLLEAHRRDPRDPDIMVALGQTRAKTGRIEDAIRCYGQALALRPGHPVALYDRGVLLQRQERLDAAAEDYRGVLRHDPRHARAATNLGYILLVKRRYREAEAQFKAALAAEPDLAQALAGLGQTLRRLGRPAEGAPLILRAIEAQPKWLSLWEELATAYEKAGMNEKAAWARQRHEEKRLKRLTPGYQESDEP